MTSQHQRVLLRAIVTDTALCIFRHEGREPDIRCKCERTRTIPQTGHSRENSQTVAHNLHCQFFWKSPQLGCSHLPLKILRLLQFTQQRFGFNQVGSAKAFCKPTVKRGKKMESLAFHTKLAPEPAQTHRCPHVTHAQLLKAA
jgi:hypothetical protein